MFSTDTEEEARSLIVLTCPVDGGGNHYARELAQEQTLDNLQRFSDKLAAAWQMMQRRKAER